METIHGESPELLIDDGYSNGGGIALYSAGDEGETITGGSGNMGSQPTSARIFWEITRVPDGAGGYTYTGGITGVDWFMNEPTSPFYAAPYNDLDKIWEIASTSNNLNEVFDAWNQDMSDEGEEKRSYFLYFLSVNAKGCSRTSAG